MLQVSEILTLWRIIAARNSFLKRYVARLKSRAGGYFGL